MCTPRLGFLTWERGTRILQGPAPQMRPLGHTAGPDWPPGGSSGRAGPRGPKPLASSVSLYQPWGEPGAPGLSHRQDRAAHTQCLRDLEHFLTSIPPTSRVSPCEHRCLCPRLKGQGWPHWEAVACPALVQLSNHPALHVGGARLGQGCRWGRPGMGKSVSRGTC